MDLFCRYNASLHGKNVFFYSAMEEIAVKCQPVCSVETVVLKNWCHPILRVVSDCHFAQIYYSLPGLLNLSVLGAVLINGRGDRSILTL